MWGGDRCMPFFFDRAATRSEIAARRLFAGRGTDLSRRGYPTAYRLRRGPTLGWIINPTFVRRRAGRQRQEPSGSTCASPIFQAIEIVKVFDLVESSMV